jgi:hypothetical protein
VETGTYIGETIFAMEPHFDKLYTVEIKREFYENVKQKYNGNKINFVLGDSLTELAKISDQLKENTIFFLDGHWSNGDTGKGVKDCPLIEEITAINENFKHHGIIIVDDVRLFGKGPIDGSGTEDFMDISVNKLLEILGYRVKLHYFLPSEHYIRDRLIIYV